MNLIHSIWKKISSIGLRDGLPDIEISRIKITNQFTFVWAVVLFFIYMKLVFVDNVDHVYITKYLFGFTVLILVLNFFQKYLLARLLALIGIPLFIFYCIALFGSFAGIEFGFIIMMTSSLLFISGTVLRISLVACNLILYILSQYYILAHSPPLAYRIDFTIKTSLFVVSALTLVIFVGFITREYDKSTKRKTNFLNTLKVQNKELLSAYEEIEQFAHIASHDLKTPLRTIISFVNLIEKNKAETFSAQEVQYFSFIKSGASRMNNLIEDLLEYSMLTKKKDLQAEWVDCNSIIDETIHDLRNNSFVKIDTKVSELPKIYSNDIYIRLLLNNLLGNAVKYNDASQVTIDISYAIADGFITLIFKDNGIGIEEEFYEQIFEIFKRLHNTNAYEGTGIGLTICKRIVNKLNGEIWLTSQVGEGSTFFVKIPYIEQDANVMK